LDSLRGLAVAAVVAYHLRHLTGGFLGVDLFFVLSGYLVTGLALDEVRRSGTVGLRAFWGRRFRRLAPALLVMVPIAMAGAVLLASWPTDDRHALGWDAFAAMTWWSNWRQLLVPGLGYWAEVPSLFRHAWSLSIEEQFYVVWPLVLTLVISVVGRGRLGRGSRRANRRFRRLVGATAGTLAGASAAWGLVLAHRLDPSDLTRVYLGSDTRALAPLAGCLTAALWWGRRPGPGLRAAGAASLVGLGVLVATTTVDGASTYRNGVLPVTAALAAVTIVGATGLTRTDPVTSWLGQRSYAIYLWSWPIQVVAERRWPALDQTRLTIGTVVATLVLAEVSWHLVERPAQRRIGWWRPVWVRRSLGGAGVACLAAVLLVTSTTATTRPPHEQLTDEQLLEIALEEPDEVSPAAEGERVMIFGDSVAFSYGATLPAELPEGIASIDNRGLPFCGMVMWWPGLTDGSICDKLEDMLHTGLSAEPDVVIWLPGAWEWYPVRTPEGEEVPAQSPRMSEVLQERFLLVARMADEVGARVILVPFTCPGHDQEPGRLTPTFKHWINQTIADAVDQLRAAGIEASLGLPPDGVCIGGINGEPTPEKNVALKDEIHASGTAEAAEWIWFDWLGPIIRETR